MTNIIRFFSLMIVAISVFVGCTQPSEPDLQDENGVPAETKMEVPTSEPDALGTDDQRASDSVEPPGEITLPDIPLPSSTGQGSDQESGTSSGTSPGEGGMELPDLDAESQQSNSSVESEAHLKLASWQAIEQRATSSGKVTVLDLWSLSCEPCVRELPGLVRLHQSFEEQLVCLSVNVDYDGRKTRPPESYAQAAKDFLDGIGAEFQNYLCNTPREDVLDQLDLVSIPAVLVFDADGKLIKRFVHAGETLDFTYQSQVAPWIKTQALASAASL